MFLVSFINYSDYGFYRMEITTVQLSKELKEKIASFGSKGERYEDILRRLYDMAVKTQLREILFSNDEDYISIEEAIKEAEEKWPKS